MTITVQQVSQLRQEQARLHETGLRKDQEIAVLQKEVRRLAVENSAAPAWVFFLSVNRPAALLMLVTRSPGTTIRLGLTLLIGKSRCPPGEKVRVTAVAAMVVGATASTRRGSHRHG